MPTFRFKSAREDNIVHPKEACFSLRNITKSYGDQPVLRGVNVDFPAGQIKALLGANGAGKSTLMKILSGKIPDYGGEVFAKGELVKFKGPREAMDSGITMIPQELGMIKSLSAFQNIVLGLEQTTFGVLRSKDQKEQIHAVFKNLGIDIPLHKNAGELPSAKQQLLAITRALLANSDLLILDEPTSMLTEKEAQGLFELLRQLRDRGVALIFIGHRFNEVFQLADSLAVLRDGMVVGECMAQETESVALQKVLVDWMVGDDHTSPHHHSHSHESVPVRAKKTVYPKTPSLKVENLKSEHLHNVSFELYPGEILGLMGLVGSGRSEILRSIAGLDPLESGKVYLDGKLVQEYNLQRAMEGGIYLSPEDRRNKALFLEHGVGTNTLHQNFEKFTWIPKGLAWMKSLGILHSDAEEKSFQYAKSFLNVSCEDYWRPTKTLSGGNQQRLILSRILLAQGKILLLDEVTAGVDVMTKKVIKQKMGEMAQEGRSILFASSEWEEVLEVSDRIVVLKDGQVLCVATPDELSESKVMEMIIHHDLESTQHYQIG